jgi:hypothetical protein
VAEGWVYGPSVDRDMIWEPGELSEVIPRLVAEAAPNAMLSGDREASAIFHV